MEILKDKKVIGFLTIAVVLIIGGAVFAFMRGAGRSSTPSDNFVQEELPILTPEDIGLEVTVRQDGKALMFEVTKADDIERIEYEITYEKEIDGEAVSEGLYGEMNIAVDGITKTDFREFGTCSSGVCRYDKVVSDVKITMKVNKKDGKVYQVEKSVSLE